MARIKLTLRYLRRLPVWTYEQREMFRRLYPAGVYEDKLPQASLQNGEGVAMVTLVPLTEKR